MNNVEWRPIETAPLSKLFAEATYVLVATSEGRVTEGTPYFSGPGRYIWMMARGENCKGSHHDSEYLKDSVTHWMYLPGPP